MMVPMTAPTPGSQPAWGGAVVGPDLAALLRACALGDEDAFARLYDAVSARVYGLVLRVVRDPAQSEEVAQEVLVEVWRTAPRYDPARGSALTWTLMLAHRRAVDWVRRAEADSRRERRVAAEAVERDFDEVAEAVTTSLEREQVRRCLGSLTELQRASVLLA